MSLFSKVVSTVEAKVGGDHTTSATLVTLRLTDSYLLALDKV